MSESQNVKLVKRAYAALEEDDIPGFLELCAPDAEWRYPAVKELSYGGFWRGHEEVARFFQTHDKAEEIVDFDLSEFVAQGDRVVALGIFRGRAKSAGRLWETRFVHVLAVRGGKIQSLEAYFDTAAAAEAHRK